MKAREVRERLKGRNVDPVVQKILETLAEQNSVQVEQMLMLAQANDQLMSMIDSTLTVAGNMKNMIESVGGDKADEPTV